jgi:hypothetical protein
MTRRPPSWLVTSLLAVAAVAAVAACSLNPQPLPPDTADSGKLNPGSGTVDSGHGPTGVDAGGSPDVQLGGGGDDGGAGFEDGEADAQVDAAADAASDASSDAPSDAPTDASDASSTDGGDDGSDSGTK